MKIDIRQEKKRKKKKRLASYQEILARLHSAVPDFAHDYDRREVRNRRERENEQVMGARA